MGIISALTLETYITVKLETRAMASVEKIAIEKLCSKCKRKISDHPATGRFHTIILYGAECAWDPDNEVKNFVASTLKKSGYDLETFGLKCEGEFTWKPGI
jgi:hypothetical protein